MSRIINEVLVCNTLFMNNSGSSVQAVACRVRGEIDGKTIKVSPHLFKGDLPLAGDPIYVSYAEGSIKERGNYRVLTNAKVALEPSSMEQRAADDAAVAAAEESHHVDQHANATQNTDPVPF